ncbi:MAG: TolC family protein [Planctomycetota bacterium]|nr:TolC family protein [Planctomycetota bacterium]
MATLHCGRQLIALLLAILMLSGCSRTKYRLDADRDAYKLMSERNVGQPWAAESYTIEQDPRSRYFDPNDPDKPPMPIDDPASNQYMQMVDGKRGWEHWRDNGQRSHLENPEWLNNLGEYVEMTPQGAIKLDVNAALKLAYIHSPSHQTQLETLYLSALDVTGERFRLDSQFFGGYDANFAHNGSLAPASLAFDSAAGQFVVTSPAETLDTNRLTLGGNPLIQMRKTFASAGQLVAGFANSFVFEFSGGDTSLTSSLANFTVLQPLLRGAGRQIALENLTFDERALLANMRSYGQFRQGFYTQIAIGELGVGRPQRGGQGTFVSVFSGQGGLGGYTGLLQNLQGIRNSEYILSIQERSLFQLEALREVGIIDLFQVDQLRQEVERQRSGLVAQRAIFEAQIDRYITFTLGLPPNLAVQLNDTLIQQFQLVSNESTVLQDSINELRDQLGALPNEPEASAVRMILDGAHQLAGPIQTQIDAVEFDLGRMKQVVPQRERSLPARDIEEFKADRKQLDVTLSDLKEEATDAITDLQKLRDEFSAEMPGATRRSLVIWLSRALRLIQRATLAQGRARLEAVTVEPIEMEPETAFKIALSNRLDFMNGRAALVDSWRQIEINANALQSVLNVTAGGDLRTARNNPVSFRAPAGSLRMGVEFDAPLTRLLERNSYRESLIRYQRNRRDFIQSRDSLHIDLRALLRNINRTRRDLAIQRRAVAIALRQVDQAQSRLYAPVAPPRPGQRTAPFGPVTTRNIVGALQSLLRTQNQFLAGWLNLYADRMRLARELGTMQLAPNGEWIKGPLPGTPGAETVPPAAAPPLPPSVPPPPPGVRPNGPPGS